MTLSQIRLAMLLPLAFGCAHAVYDGQPDMSDSNTGEVSVAGGKSVADLLPNMPADSGVAGSDTTDPASGGAAAGGEPSLAGTGSSGAAGSAGTIEAGGAPAGGSPSTAGAPSGGAATAGAPSGGAPSGGAATAGAPSGGTTSAAGSTSVAGSTSIAGAASAGAPSTGCSGIPTWSQKTYVEGDKVQSGNKIYKCRAWPNDGWCGAGPVYAPATGAAWMDAWILVGPC